MKFKLFLFVSVLILIPHTTAAYDLADLKAELASIFDRLLYIQGQLASLVPSSTFSVSSNSNQLGLDCLLASSKNLQLHDVNSSVKEMQKILNLSPNTQISSFGDGAPGSESTYFGMMTYSAVVKFQKKYNISPAEGFVGPTTRAKLKEVCLNANSSSASSKISSSFSTPNPAPNPQPTPQPTPTPNPTPVVPPPVAPAPSPAPASAPSPANSASTIQWGAYAGDNPSDLAVFESLVGKEVNIQAVFLGLYDSISSAYKTSLGAKGKTLLVFLEPNVSFDAINDGSQDAAIKKFANSVKSYDYPVILAPFHEMNLNYSPWGYGVSGNTPAKFKQAWIRIHGLFAAEGATKVKFMIVYNNDSLPNIVGNHFVDYYPGDNYVDYIGIDGFNFGEPWQNFSAVFDHAFAEIASYEKPVFISSIASAAGSGKAAWITEGLGSKIKNYKNFAGWIWFNQNKEQNWLVNSDTAALTAFKAVLP